MDVADPDLAADPDPHRGQDVGQWAGPVEDPDVGRVAVEEPLRAVQIDAEVALEHAVEAVQRVDDQADQPDHRDPGVGPGEAGAQGGHGC